MNEGAEAPAGGDEPRGRGAVLAPLAGPLLIVLGVILILKDFLTGALFPRAFEVVGEWLTTFCYQGRALRAGHIPALNPHVMGGIPFAADPQSGWMNLPAMGLFGVLRCDLAFRAYLVLLPVLAGLGIYWFLRSEGLTRSAATVGGLVLALPLAGSKNLMNPWVAGWIAWSAVLLATASRFWHAEESWRRILWALACAVAWGQLGSAHFSTGLGVGTGFLIAYLAVKAVRDVSTKRSTARASIAWIAFLLATLVAANLVALLPRLVYLRRTPLAVGFEPLQDLIRGYGGVSHGPGRPLPAPWPVAMALSPGIHQGAVALALCFGGVVVRRRRALVATFAVMGAASYVMTLPITERTLVPLIENSSLSQTYLHGPYRVQPGVFIALALLAGIGVDSWIRAGALGQRALIAGPGIALWAVLLAVYQPPAARVALLALGAALSAAALAVTARFRHLALLIPLVLAAELWLNGRPPSDATLAAISKERRRTVAVDGVATWTKLYPAVYIQGGPISKALETRTDARYVTSAPRVFDVNGYFGRIDPEWWGLMGDQQSMLFGLREAQGYNATLPLRFWEFVRAIEPGKKINYPPDYFVRVPEVARDLFQIGWVVGQVSDPPDGADATPVARQGEWALYRLPGAPPMATVVGQWADVRSADAALDEVTAIGFDPQSTVVVERDPGLRDEGMAPGPAGEATYRQLGDQAATVEVRASRPAVVVVRNTYDPNWRASVDGRPVPVLAADFVVQGIAVGAGTHVIRLRYHDPTIGYGLIGSVLTVVLLLGGAVVLRRRRSPDGRDGANPLSKEPASPLLGLIESDWGHPATSA